ncbi:MAG: hypothetical protein DMF08_08255 [Verrucomicrobia bacterium]|nr:MAG: hypothetical protein DMF08_08255 [Verrucomicrobiota bacterium]
MALAQTLGIAVGECADVEREAIKLEIDDHKMYYDKRDLWPMLVRAGFKPSQIRLRYHKFGLNLFAAATKNEGDRHN